MRSQTLATLLTMAFLLLSRPAFAQQDDQRAEAERQLASILVELYNLSQQQVPLERQSTLGPDALLEPSVGERRTRGGFSLVDWFWGRDPQEAAESLAGHVLDMVHRIEVGDFILEADQVSFSIPGFTFTYKIGSAQ